MSKGKLKVVLCWHMHQPEYREPMSGAFQLPWTYLHATKDYVDMAGHLEAVPDARAVVNFVPTLLEQIEDYSAQVQGSLREGIPIRDPVLGALNMAALPDDREHMLLLLKASLRANEKRLIERFAPYRRLAEMARWLIANPHALGYVDEQFVVDCLVWYHLAWLGETVRRQDLRVKSLMDKGAGYTLRDRRVLLEIIGGLLAAIPERYRTLHARGQVELSLTPYAHPILPLLLDPGSAREALPEVELPMLDGYHGGAERVRWHIEQGLASFARFFGLRPQGCWPSEGGVSRATLELLEEQGFRWSASGEQVLRNSLERGAQIKEAERREGLHRPWRLTGREHRCFFRSDSLSDLIGFTFADWHADDAVAHLLVELERIADASPEPRQRVVSIILDGENAWEHYPDNGYHFLRALYGRLAEHPKLEMTTFSGCLDADMPCGELKTLVAGSWVYGTFSTWIGDRDKNRGWEMLADAERAYRAAREAQALSPERLHAVSRQLAVCEGSDWFWWFGDYNPADSVRDFDRLFRMHLGNFYELLGHDRPEYLSRPFTHGGGQPEAGGTMRRGA